MPLKPRIGVHYESIRPQETAEMAIQRLKIRPKDWVILPIIKLSGSQKILPLKFSGISDSMTKIEGPGFIIEKMYDLLTKSQIS